ncbi:DUF2971 domain-containing protein [Paenibacillus sp. KQZ6P-2]|uniref:DUF2971 domain-containing protein n=1 Tax=Paenibacillus mangrovi TaxID=2931978 RepID=A0A9X1WIT0_9BACL|nr:DUF2971 domain-containing protein [Paenibacillus mangrovi]MCJ8010152.1 DUF2971 domain-containing protein [Paenibacillus mangrovi]
MYKPLFNQFDFAWKFEFTHQSNLFHYTNAVALKSIIEKQELWATKSNFLNDYTETIYILEVLNHVYNFIKERYNSDTVEFFDLIMEDVKYDFISKQNGNDSNSMFVISLSENPDSLSLWSQYSSVDGYNIGLDLNKIINSIKQIQEENNMFDFCYLSKIIYDYTQQRSILFNELIRIYDFYKTNDDGEPDRKREALFICRSAIETYSLFFKKQQFSQEEEYRIAFTIFNRDKLKNNVDYRIGNGSFVPYIKFPISGDVPFQNITIGPKNNIDTSKYGLMHYLEHKGYQDLKNNILKSEITLRF